MPNALITDADRATLVNFLEVEQAIFERCQKFIEADYQAQQARLRHVRLALQGMIADLGATHVEVERFLDNAAVIAGSFGDATVADILTGIRERIELFVVKSSIADDNLPF